jgi:hypothetical protein
MGSLELAPTAQPLLGALSVDDGSSYWLAWSAGILYGLRSSPSLPSKSADGSCLEASPGQSYSGGELSLCAWSVRMKDQIAANDVRIHGVSLGDVPPPPLPPPQSHLQQPPLVPQEAHRRQQVATGRDGGVHSERQRDVRTGINSPTDSDVPLSTDGARDDSGTVAASSKLVNVWLHGGALLSLAVESGERVGDVWAPPKPPIDGDGSVSAAGAWAAAPHAAAAEGRDGGSSATVLGSALVLLGTVRASPVYIVSKGAASIRSSHPCCDRSSRLHVAVA